MISSFIRTLLAWRSWLRRGRGASAAESLMLMGVFLYFRMLVLEGTDRFSG
jgi:hypothetical protein